MCLGKSHMMSKTPKLCRQTQSDILNPFTLSCKSDSPATRVHCCPLSRVLVKVSSKNECGDIWDAVLMSPFYFLRFCSYVSK